MQKMLGRPLDEALKSLPDDQTPPRIMETAAPRKDGVRQGGTLRVIACRENEWIVARFIDGAPREKEDS